MGTSDLARYSHSSTALYGEPNSALAVPVCHHVLLNDTTAESQKSLADAEIFEAAGTAATYIAELVEAFPQFSCCSLSIHFKKHPVDKSEGRD
jgi:hypothetical protein